MKKGTMPSGVQEGINIIDAQTVTFVLYDKDKNGKSKDYAYILGDFNNWTLANDETSQMNRDDAAGCWWITVNGLDTNKEYAFQYYVGDKGGESIRIGDPYCEKILDPNNDKYIQASTYADDMTYPAKAKGIVSVFQTQKDNYSWSDFSITDPDKLVIYELLLRDFTATGDIHGAMDKLAYLKAMGVNAIELMPTQEFDGNDSWGYNPCYFFAMDKAYGTKKDYKDFEMFVDWRILSPRGDSGLYLRGAPQVQIWDAHNMWNIGSGGLYNNKKNPDKALLIADNQVGSWNTFRIKMVGEKVTVWLNGKLVVDNTTLENYWDRTKPIFPVEQIELQCHGDPVEFRNIFIKEL